MSRISVVGLLAVGLVYAQLGCSAQAAEDNSSLGMGMAGMSALAGMAAGMTAPAGAGGIGGASVPVAGMVAASGGAGGALVTGGSGGAAGDVSSMAGVGAMTGGSGGAAGMLTGGSSGEGGEGGVAGMEPPMASMPCMSTGQDLLIVGDSYVSYINPLQPPLEAEARGASQLPAGQSYRNLAVPGAFIAQIQSQWQSGKSTNPKYVVMTGGGNDVLLGMSQCLAAGSDTIPACVAVVDGAVATGGEMMADMKASGVAGVVYFFYPHIPAGGADLLDYALPKIRENCEALKDNTFDCAVVDTIPAFEGHPEYVFLDGIHPSLSGQAVIAGLVWDAMAEHCIGQMSGCCI